MWELKIPLTLSDAEALLVSMWKMLRKNPIAMKISLRMKRASLKNAISIIIQQAQTTELIQVMIILSSMITKAKPGAENRPSIPGVQRMSQLAEGIAPITIERYKTIFTCSLIKRFFCLFLRSEQTCWCNLLHIWWFGIKSKILAI